MMARVRVIVFFMLWFIAFFVVFFTLFLGVERILENAHVINGFRISIGWWETIPVHGWHRVPPDPQYLNHLRNSGGWTV
jgi:hypothetical protein